MSEQIRTYHSDRCLYCAALLPADDWSSQFCEVCGADATEPVAIDATPHNWDIFWTEVARLYRTYGMSEEPS